MKLTEAEKKMVMRARGDEVYNANPAHVIHVEDVDSVEAMGVEIFELLTNEAEVDTICNNCGWPVKAGDDYCRYCKEGLFWEKRG